MVVQMATKILARNMKAPAIDSTKLNLAAFFRISRKECRADGQKDSEVMAQ